MHNTNRNFCKHTTGSNPNLLDASMNGGAYLDLEDKCSTGEEGSLSADLPR